MSTIQTIVRLTSQTPTIDYHVNRHYCKLMKAYNRVNHCKVVIDSLKNPIQKDKLYSVHIKVTISGKELISKKQNHNLLIAIRDCFTAAAHLLERSRKKKSGIKKLKSYCRGLRKPVAGQFLVPSMKAVTGTSIQLAGSFDNNKGCLPVGKPLF